MLDFVLDLFFPTGSGRLEKRIVDAVSGDGISVESWKAGAIKRALNESGWLGDEVIAAGQLRQGKAPSLVAMVTGWALVELLRPRRSKSLPRQFVLASTASSRSRRAVAVTRRATTRPGSSRGSSAPGRATRCGYSISPKARSRRAEPWSSTASNGSPSRGRI
jgi:hypothetical protein